MTLSPRSPNVEPPNHLAGFIEPGLFLSRTLFTLADTLYGLILKGQAMLVDYYFYLVAIPAVLIVGISKGGFGGGLGMAGVPIMALAVAPPQAAAIFLPILCVMDVFSLYAWRKTWDKRNVIILIPAAAMGILIGAAMWRYLNADGLRLFIGIIAVTFGLYHLLRQRLTPKAATQPSWPKGLFWGTLSGLTSFTAHAGGPPATVYLLPQKLDRSVYQGTIAVVFIAINYMKIGPYWWLGQFTSENLVTSLLLLPLAPLGIWLGVWLHKRISDKTFYSVILGALFLTGGKLIYEGGMGLLQLG